MGATPENSNSSTTKSNRTQKRKGPSLASIRRNKVLSTEGHTVRFLYLILKQLELKPVDWEKIAEKTDLPGGHAARARFSRFRRQMDKILQSEEILEAKLENTEGEDSRLGTMDAIEEEVKCLNPFGIKYEYPTSGVKFEQDAGNQWTLTRQPFQIKAESELKSYANRIERVKLEGGHDSLPAVNLSRKGAPAVIKIEDDDAMDIGEGGHISQGSAVLLRPCRKDSVWEFGKHSASTNKLSAPRDHHRSGFTQMQRQNSRNIGFTTADPDVEVICVNGQPLTSTPPPLFAPRDPFSMPADIDFDTDYEHMKG